MRLAKVCPPLPEPWPPVALDAFLALLGSGESMIPAWEDLDQAGLISTLLPGWERLRSMPQRDPIHLYTVDRHLMQTAVEAAGSGAPGVAGPTCCCWPRSCTTSARGTRDEYPDHSAAGAALVGPWLRRLGVPPRGRGGDHHADPAPPAAAPTRPPGATRTTRPPSPRWSSMPSGRCDPRPAARAHRWPTPGPPVRPRGAPGGRARSAHLVSRVRRALAGEPPAEPPAMTAGGARARSRPAGSASSSSRCPARCG